MTDLPERPRAHVLETANERAFQSALPNEWPDDPPRKDYGIDTVVQIFEPAGETNVATGLQFGAQLKGTDDDTSRALSVGVKWKTVNLWRALPYPVLVVRYLAADDALLAVWAHEHDRDLDRSLEHAYYRFDRERDRLTPDRALELADEVRWFNDVRTLRFDWPVRVSVIDEVGAPRGLADLLLRCRALQSGLGKVVEFQVRPVEFGPVLRLTHDQIAFELGAGVGAVLRTDGNTESMLAHPAAPSDVLVLIATGLANAGLDEVATAILERALPSALSFWSTPALRLGLAALRSGRPDLVIAVIAKVADVSPGEAIHLAIALQHQGLDVLGPAEREQIETSLRRGVETAPDNNRGRLWWAFGWWLAETGQTGDSRLAFAEAIQRDPSLVAEPEFWYERGRVCTDDGDRDEGLMCYQRALELSGDDKRYLALCADLLLKRGDTHEAAEMFGRASADEGPAFARLGSLVTDHVAASAELLRLVRESPDEIVAAIDVDDSVPNDFEIPTVEAAADLIDADPLNPVGWGLLALNLPRRLATECLVVAAWLARFDLDLWGRAVMSALAQRGGEDLMTQDIVSVADMYVGDMLEGFAAALSREFAVRLMQLDPGAAVEAENDFGEQLITLRNLLSEARRRRERRPAPCN